MADNEFQLFMRYATHEEKAEWTEAWMSGNADKHNIHQQIIAVCKERAAKEKL